MLTSKRVLLATLFGLVCGVVCMWLATSRPGAAPMAANMKLTLITSRMLMGFMIGISALRLSWYLHGIILGVVGSVPMVMTTVDDPTAAVSAIVMGAIYGFLIELLTSVAFKSKPVGSP